MLKLSSNLKIFVIRHFHSIKKHKVPVTRQLHNFAHQKLLGKYLFLTNTVSSGLLMAAGDGVQQQIEFYKKVHKKETYDWIRTMNMTIVGFALGPVQHFFYKYIDFILPKRTLKSVMKKILLDQTVASPSAICIFFYGLGLLEDGDFKEAHKEMKQKFLTIYMMDWIVWPPTQYLNFAYLPAKYRVVYVNFITMLYDVFLSYVKYENKDFHYSQFLRLPNLPRWRIRYATSPLVLTEVACQGATLVHDQPEPVVS
ncbi:mpv17-like protein 2 isoform X1 [Macrosteles quadrilineatus]|uniref:mpv17-like protein 2 isoform X1 n=1 Tax=Macrosteles quadrilineatus TaxID=74068 RepID=UPI0023E0E560|nr:mpv17-like protein 2 isoform X1 [Macrosteles quadrilineatus]